MAGGIVYFKWEHRFRLVFNQWTHEFGVIWNRELQLYIVCMAVTEMVEIQSAFMMPIEWLFSRHIADQAIQNATRWFPPMHAVGRQINGFFLSTEPRWMNFNSMSLWDYKHYKLYWSHIMFSIILAQLLKRFRFILWFLFSIHQNVR